MPARSAILDFIAVLLAILRFADNHDPPLLFLLDILLDVLLAISGIAEVLQTIWTEQEVGIYEGLVLAIYLWLMIEALVADLHKLGLLRGGAAEEH